MATADEEHVLARAIRTFEEQKRELLREHEGEWIAIHEEERLGVYGTRREALEAGYRRFSPGTGNPFLVRKILPQQEPIVARTVWIGPADAT